MFAVPYHQAQASFDAWRYLGMDGRGWSPHRAAAPNVRAGSVMAYDASRRRVVLYGGTTSSDAGANWRYMGIRRHAMSYRTGAFTTARHTRALAMMPHASVSSAFGGNDQNDTEPRRDLGMERRLSEPVGHPPAAEQQRRDGLRSSAMSSCYVAATMRRGARCRRVAQRDTGTER
jgi:hypothetical protein